MKRLVALLVSLMLVMTVMVASADKIQIRYATYEVGTHLSAPAETYMLERFNELYGDQYELIVEELPTDTEYTNKMKTLVTAKELPYVIDGKNGLRDLAIKNGLCVDLKPFLDADPDFRDNVIGPEAIAANTSEDGKIYSVVPDLMAIGYFYNKTMFEQAGIKPAETWEEFWTNCDALLNIGVYPLTLMTGENSWTTNLLLAAMIGGKGEAGVKLMNTKYPETYQTPEMIEALGEIQVALQKYATPDALGAAYANAANNFLTEQSAIIFNGSWMIESFSNQELANEGLADRIGFALYPGKGMVKTYAEGYSICAPTPETQQGAWELLKLKCSKELQEKRLELAGNLPVSPTLEISQEYLDQNPLFAANAAGVAEADYAVQTFDVTAYASVVDAFSVYYPELAAGTLDAAGMAAKLDEAAAAAK